MPAFLNAAPPPGVDRLRRGWRRLTAMAIIVLPASPAAGAEAPLLPPQLPPAPSQNTQIKSISGLPPALKRTVINDFIKRVADSLRKENGIDNPIRTAWEVTYDAWDSATGINLRAVAFRMRRDTGERVLPFDAVPDADLEMFLDVARKAWCK